MAEIDAGLLSLDRQLRYASAVALTRTAKDAQARSISAIRRTFTTRNSWYEPSSRFGVRVQTATPSSLVSAVETAADWLALHETGGEKRPRTGVHLAVPTSKVRRSKKAIITRADRPSNIRQGFIVTRKDGEVWLYRRAGRSRYPIVPMYRLVKRARIERNSVVIEPTTRAFDERMVPHFFRALDDALRTAK